MRRGLAAVITAVALHGCTEVGEARSDAPPSAAARAAAVEPVPAPASLTTASLAAASSVAASADDGPGADAPQEARGDTIPGTVWTEADWAILVEKLRWAEERRLDTLPTGAALAALGRTFVGTRYTPGTLEAPGPEHLVVNLRELDCVTFIETVWALTRLHRHQGIGVLADPDAARRAYEEHLRSIRYRDGVLDGYPSRLHYFSDWLWNHEDRGDLVLVTEALGGVPDPEPVDFMSTHSDAYRQLADPANLEAIAVRERELEARGPRIYLPQSAIADAAGGIREGDVIAATSTVAGLDIAHTGIAVWEGDRLHLLHAPLVGRNVEISTVPLAERIAGITGQDGIMVARLADEG